MLPVFQHANSEVLTPKCPTNTCKMAPLPPDPHPLVLERRAPITWNLAWTCPSLFNWKAWHSTKLLKKLFVANVIQVFTWHPARAVSSKLLLVFTLQLGAQKSIRTFLANFHALSATGPEKSVLASEI